MAFYLKFIIFFQFKVWINKNKFQNYDEKYLERLILIKYYFLKIWVR